MSHASSDEPRPLSDVPTVSLAASQPGAAADQQTLGPAASQSTDGPLRVSIPGHEILGELGRGGMGVVYKARQTHLNRVVAVKVVLAGGHASADELARFRAEAEAVARMQHPNIVQIFETGQQDGLPYFTLEYVDGGSLAHKLDGTPLPPSEAAKLVETLARAVHYAHTHGVVHRDLKPGNVLLANDGTPKITDFGLAKKVEGGGLTRSGAIMGTPSYMAPEQADGQTQRIGPATDVYALGAILYECVTGRPPFKAATDLDTILQVISDDPVPPTQLQSKTPRDLETICLKCLRKEPGARYASAAALADDLRRLAEGRAILARSVGRLERTAKWVQRNPGPASMMAAVTLTLLAGTAISTGFGIYARQQAADAATARDGLATANETLTHTAADLKQSRDDLERTFARSLLRPMALQGGDEPMNEGEWEALWELATNRRGRLGYRFVEEASRNSKTIRQLRDRASLLLPAAVGLEAEQRVEVEALLLARLDDPTLTDQQKTDLGLAASAGDGLSSPAALRVARQLTRAMTDSIDESTLSKLAQGLSALAARMEAQDAAQAANTLLKAIKDTQDRTAVCYLAQGLAAVAARMEARHAATVTAQAASTLIQAMRKNGNIPTLCLQAWALSAVAASMEPKDAANVNRSAAWLLVQAMKAIADIKDTSSDLRSLAQGVSALATHMEAQDAAIVSSQAANMLIQVLMNNKDAKAVRSLAEGISALAAHQKVKNADQAANCLVLALRDNTNDLDALLSLAKGLSAVAASLDASDAARAATTLVQAIKDTTRPAALEYLAEGLSALADRMEAKDAAEAANSVFLVMKDNKNAKALQHLAVGLAALAARLEPKDAASVTGPAATTLVQAINGTKDPLAVYHLAQGLTAVAARMEVRDGTIVNAQLATTLLQIIREAKDPNLLSLLARPLSAVAARMEPKDAASVTGPAAITLVQVMKDTTDAFALHNLAEGLSAVATYMEAKDAKQVTDSLLLAMKDAKDLAALGALAEALSAMAARMEAKDATTTSAQAATAIVQALKDPRYPFALRPLAQALSAIPPTEIPSHSATAASAVLTPAGSGHPLTIFALLVPVAEPPPCRLSTQQLVELLKMPTCNDKARRIILDQLGNRYRHTFADVWEFVRFAEEQKLALDFSTPPKRPEAVAATTATP
jgi:hypothetical protein